MELGWGSTEVEVRIGIVRPGPSLLRLRWSADGRVLGERRLLGDRAVLHVPAGPLVLELVDDRAAHDPRRQAPARTTLRTAPGSRHDVRLVMRHGASVHATLRRADGSPDRFGRLEVLLADGSVRHGRADGDGEVVVAGLPAGAVRVSARSGDRVSTQVPVCLRAGEGVALDLRADLAALTPPSLVPAALGGAVAGRVLDAATRTPVRAARVELRDARGTLLARGRTDATGHYLLGGDLGSVAGASVVVRSGPDRAAVDRAVVRGVAVTGSGVTAAPETLLPRTPSRLPALHERGTVTALRLPSLRV